MVFPGLRTSFMPNVWYFNTLMHFTKWAIFCSLTLGSRFFTPTVQQFVLKIMKLPVKFQFISSSFTLPIEWVMKIKREPDNSFSTNLHVTLPWRPERLKTLRRSPWTDLYQMFLNARESVRYCTACTSWSRARTIGLKSVTSNFVDLP